MAVHAIIRADHITYGVIAEDDDPGRMIHLEALAVDDDGNLVLPLAPGMGGKAQLYIYAPVSLSLGQLKQAAVEAITDAYGLDHLDTVFLDF